MPFHLNLCVSPCKKVIFILLSFFKKAQNFYFKFFKQITYFISSHVSSPKVVITKSSKAWLTNPYYREKYKKNHFSIEMIIWLVPEIFILKTSKIPKINIYLPFWFLKRLSISRHVNFPLIFFFFLFKFKLGKIHVWTLRVEESD